MLHDDEKPLNENEELRARTFRSSSIFPVPPATGVDLYCALVTGKPRLSPGQRPFTTVGGVELNTSDDAFATAGKRTPEHRYHAT